MVLVFLYNSVDNTQSTFATIASELMKISESESEVAIDWFKRNKMVVNLYKFLGFMLEK